MNILHRIVELQAPTITRQTTDTDEEYNFIEELIEGTKPKFPGIKHHYLIATPFRYPLPVQPPYMARFKPPYFNKNVFYGADGFETCAFEYCYHWLRQRVHLSISQGVEPRTHFQVDFDDSSYVDVSAHKDVAKLISRKDYSASHEFVKTQQNLVSIIYPSCRDPQNGKCAAVFELGVLGLSPRYARELHLIYDGTRKACSVEDAIAVNEPLTIEWSQVA